MVNYQKNWYVLFSLGFFVFCLGVKWTVIHQYGSDMPYMDQWNGEGTAIILPWLEGKFNFIESFWTPHNEHRIGWTRLWSLGWVLLNDQWDPLLVTTVNSVVHLSVGLVLIFILRKFFDGKMYWLGPLVIVSIYSFPIAWENTLQAFQISVYLSLGCALFVLSTLTNCKLTSFTGALGVFMAFAGIPCLSAAFAPPAAIVIVRNLRAYKSRTWDKHDILVSVTCLVILFLALLSVNPTPGHEPLRAQSFFQFIGFFIEVCSIPFHHEHWLFRLVAASLLQAPFLLFIVQLFRKNGKDWQKHELTLFALGTWLFLQTAAISYSRGNTGIGTRHLDTFAILLVTNAASLTYLTNSPIKNWRFKIKSLSIIWIILMSTGLASFSRSEIKSHLQNFPHTWRTMKVHVHNFLTDNNATKFQQVPITSLPFISHPFMMNFLQNEKVQNILPVGIRKPLGLVEFKKIGFSSELNHNFLREENSNVRYYSTISSRSYWESEEMMTKSALPILRIKFAGHPDLSTSSIRIESGGKMHPLKIKHFNGNGWQSAHLFIPQEFDTFKLVAECKDPDKWLAFEEPVEIGFGSWLAHQMRKKASFLYIMGTLALTVALFSLQYGNPIILRLKNLQLISEKNPGKFSYKSFIFLAILTCIFISILAFNYINSYFVKSILYFSIIFLFFYSILLYLILYLKSYFDNHLITFIVSYSLILVLAYLGFWVSFFNHVIGYIYFLIFLFIPLITLLFKKSLDSIKSLGKNFHTPIFLVLIFGLLYIIFYYLGGSTHNIETTAATRPHSLPIDNAIPRLFADKIHNGADPRTILKSLEWTSSDRPPLQSCFILLFKPLHSLLPFDNITVSYIPGIIFNLMWIPAVWYFLLLFTKDFKSRLLIIFIVASTPFFIINSFYTWPKLGAASFLVFGTTILFKQDRPSYLEYLLVSVLFTLAWLSHGGIAFTILPLLLSLLVLKKIPCVKTILHGACISLTILIPWIIYQKMYDPPGNRLIKWHLAGVIDVDERGVLETLYDSYTGISFSDFIEKTWSNICLIIGSEFRCLHILNSSADNQNFDFFIFSRSILIPITFILPILLIKKSFLKIKELPEHFVTFMIIVLVSLGLWCALMFLPNSTISHHGSYANNLISIVLVMILIKQLYPRLLYIILSYNLIYLYINF